MTLSSAFNIINTSFATIGTQSATIAANVANANTPGYSTETANLGTTPFNGVRVFSVTRDANAALAAQVNATTSNAAAQSAISTSLSTLAATVSDSASSTASGALQNGNSPFAMLGGLQDAIATFEASPSSQSAAAAAVTAAENVAASLNAGAQAVTQVRTAADQGIAQAVSSVNSLLAQFEPVNNAIISGLANGADVGALQDQRDSLVTQIAQQIGVSTSINGNGSMAIFTDSGVTLFQASPTQVTFAPSGTLGPGPAGAAVVVDGEPITGPASNMPIQSGAIAGLVQLRDTSRRNIRRSSIRSPAT